MKGLSIKPINCNQCPDCYEAKIKHNEWDIDKVIKSLRKYDKKRFEWKEKNHNVQNLEPHNIHGGEPLLLPFDDLRRLLRYNYKYFGRNGIQTNLLHMRSAHLDLFTGYNVSVGISLDGHLPGMNRGRFPSHNVSNKRIEKELTSIIKNMQYMKRAKINMNAITVLRDCNSNLQNIKSFVHVIEDFGINFIRLTPGTIYDPKRKDHEITNDKLFEVYKTLFDNMHLFKNLQIAPITDIIDAMMGNIGNLVCGFKDCDPWSSTAEMTMMGNGEIGTCLHAAGALDGLQMIRGDNQSFTRSEVLKQIPQESGGCKDCKYFHMCRGNCPGQAIGNDWRNKSRFCQGYQMTFEYIYNRLKSQFPNIYLTPDFYPDEPDKEYIEKSINRSVNRKCDRIRMPKTKSEKWNPVELPGGFLHQDSNSIEWQRLNPGWSK